MADCWAEAMAAQQKDAGLSDRFARMHKLLGENEAAINDELISAQGAAVDVGGYYAPDSEKASIAMRPSAIFNEILASL